mmetsp:Transcript_10713/g.16010  ORF Transcript_10713/g.16010 Transcript_10713/m.16010 type:complete len:90 (+) Transcript_10713:3-272(+)
MTEKSKEKLNLEKVATEAAEEKEVDAERTKSALSSLNSGQNGNAPTIVKLNAQDVKYIMDELDTTKDKTESALIESKGDVVKAIRLLLH